MKKFHRHFITFFLITAGLYLAGCKLLTQPNSNPPPSSSGNITTGPSRTLLSQDVTSSGGTIKISAPGDSLDGLTITVPSGSYSTSRNFTISEAHITSHVLGANFNPVSPLINISNGGGYSATPMILRIPAKIPSGDFAMAFFYDDVHGKLEGLPILAMDNNSVTVMTRHFDESAIANISGAGDHKGERISGLADFAQLVVTAIPASLLIQGTNNSDFKPGTDDWQFVNYGSYLAPGGHCFGQSMGMMWYYSVKQKSLGSLYDKYDNDGVTKTPYIWADDVNAYKFCSVLQSHWYSGFQNSIIKDIQSTDAKLTYMAFSYSILLTHDPQLVCIYSPTQAHAMVIFKTSNGTLSVCDPNYPASWSNQILFNSGTDAFTPYNAKANGNDSTQAYPGIYYYAKSACIDWNGISDDWASFQNGTIGNGLFPDFHIQVSSNGGPAVDLNPDTTLKKDSLTFSVSGSVPLKLWAIYSSPTDLINGWPSLTYKFASNNYQLGFAVFDTGSHWVGFKWIPFTVNADTENLGDVHLTGNEGTTVFPTGRGTAYYGEYGSLFITTYWIDDPKHPETKSEISIQVGDSVTKPATYNIDPSNTFIKHYNLKNGVYQSEQLIGTGGGIKFTRFNSLHDFQGTFQFDGKVSVKDSTSTLIYGSFSAP